MDKMADSSNYLVIDSKNNQSNEINRHRLIENGQKSNLNQPKSKKSIPIVSVDQVELDFQNSIQNDFLNMTSDEIEHY